MNALPAHLLADFKGILSSFRDMVIEEPKSASALTADTLLHLNTEIEQCPLCTHRNKRPPVTGFGSPDATILVISPLPCTPEEHHSTGNFEGEAGALLFRMFEAIEIPRDRLYLTHSVKCVLDSAPLDPEEIARACRPYLDREIEAIRPDLLCSLDCTLTRRLAGTEIPATGCEGHYHEYKGIPLTTLPPPTLLLSMPEKKREAWEMLQSIRTRLQEIRTARADS